MKSRNARVAVGSCLATMIAVASASMPAAAQCGAWKPLGAGVANPPAGFAPGVAVLTTYDGRLIAGGVFTTAGGGPASFVAVWDGAAWAPLGGGLNGRVLSLTVFNGDLIVGGSFTAAEAGTVPALGVARWDGAAWHAMGNGLSNGGVSALAVYNGQLIAGGFFTTSGATMVNRIARWDGTSWQPLSGGGVTAAPPPFSPYVEALGVYNNELIVGGLFTTAGGVTNLHSIAAWNGASWHALGAGAQGGTPVSVVRALGVYGGHLVAGGHFTMAGSVSASRIARWNGSTWLAAGPGTNDDVLDLATQGGTLLAAGFFTTAGGQPANYVARWNGVAWQRYGDGLGDFDSGTSPSVSALAHFGGEVVIGGTFTTANGSPVNFITRWDNQVDPDGSGTVDVDDLFAVINAWGPCPAPCSPGGYGTPGSCAADVDENCTVDVDDLMDVINGWGACP